MRYGIYLSAFMLAFAAWPGPPASAQENVADALFKKGLKDMEQGRFDAGCPALAESDRIDPQLGCVFALADCWQRAGKIQSAVDSYGEYLRRFALRSPREQQDQLGREKIAASHKAALEPQVPSLTLIVVSIPKGTKITFDSIEMTPVSLGVAISINPGEHTIVLQAPGGPRDIRRFTIVRGEKKSILLQTEAPAGPARRPEAAPPPSPPDDSPTGPEAPAIAPGAQNDTTSGQRVAAYLIGGIGVSGIAVGIVTGALVLDKKRTVDDGCVGTVCTKDGMAAANDARPLALASNLGFIIGGGALITGVVLYFTAPSAPRTGRATPWVSADAAPLGDEGAVLRVHGAW
jgi:hypothetical protein